MIRSNATGTAAKWHMLLYGSGETGKSRLLGSLPRSNPDFFCSPSGKVVYLAADPEGARLGSILPDDRKYLEVVELDYKKDIFEQLNSLFGGTGDCKWVADEGFKTIITDTLTVAVRAMLGQLADSGKFSDKNIRISRSHSLPMQGDYMAAGRLLDELMRTQQAAPYHSIVACHEQEVHPDEGRRGESIGGPAGVGRAAVRLMVNYYNTVLRVHQRPKPRTQIGAKLEMERVVSTTTQGIWQAKFRVPAPINPIPEILVDPDPINVWQKLAAAQEVK